MLTVIEAAQSLGRHPETVRRWIWSGRVRSEKIAGRHMIAEGELRRIASHTSHGGGFGAWVNRVHEFNDERGFTPGGLPSGAELVRAERESH